MIFTQTPKKNYVDDFFFFSGTSSAVPFFTSSTSKEREKSNGKESVSCFDNNLELQSGLNYSLRKRKREEEDSSIYSKLKCKCDLCMKIINEVKSNETKKKETNIRAFLFDSKDNKENIFKDNYTTNFIRKCFLDSPNKSANDLMLIKAHTVKRKSKKKKGIFIIN